MQTSFDVAVVGAGVFGVWTAYQLRRSGANVILLDAYGPGNSRASSGGESRIIRMGYGPDEIYTKSASRSFLLWRQFFEEIEVSKTESALRLFQQTGVLWLAQATDPYCYATLQTLQHLGIRIEQLDAQELSRRYPQFDFSQVAWGLLEPESGALMARRAVQAVAALIKAEGVPILVETVVPPISRGRVNSLLTSKGTSVAADKFVFACGPWLPKLFPELLGRIIHVTRQEVFFFGTPAGDDRFSPERMPIWVDFNDLVYAIPNLENRGFKLAIDAHGPEFDPDMDDRIVTLAGLQAARAYLQKRIPALVNAPVTESRVCQYENTSNGDFLIDRHPDFENVWIVGGGSGHGFKHAPAVSEYVVSMISNHGTTEPRFRLATKGLQQQRQVY
jgi:sarcosine oxidase